LHWLMAGVAALAEESGRTNPAKENALMTPTRVITIVRHVNRRTRPGKPCSKDVTFVLKKTFGLIKSQFISKRVSALLIRGIGSPR